MSCIVRGGEGGKLNNAFSADAAGFRNPPTPPSYVKLTFTFDFLFSFFFRISCFLFRNCTVKYFDLIFKILS